MHTDDLSSLKLKQANGIYITIGVIVPWISSARSAIVSKLLSGHSNLELILCNRGEQRAVWV